MATRTARTAWDGPIQEGSGQVELTSSGTGTFDVSFPRRIADSAEGVTSPEELIAAAHSSCFAMQLAGFIGEAGAEPVRLQITADVSVGPDPEGGLHLTEIKLTVRGEVPGIDEAQFKELAEKTKVGCPVSKALAAVPMTVEAALD